MTKHRNETPVTYLNKGQTYSLHIADSNPVAPFQSAKYRTHIWISFDEEEQRSRPAACWQLWKNCRGLNEIRRHGGKLRAVEYVDPVQADKKQKNRHIQLESASFDGFCITWTPSPTSDAFACTMPIRFNFLSTDFSHSKGVKGTPVRLCMKTETIPADNNQSSNAKVYYGKVKLFRDHGAERRLSNDIAHVKRSIDKLRQQMAEAEMGGAGFRKRRRSRGSMALIKAVDRPIKTIKPYRRWSVDTENTTGERTPPEDDLQTKLETMQAMFSSTRPVSALNLHGDELDELFHPLIQLPREIKVEGTDQLQGVTWASALSLEGSVALNHSSHHTMRPQLSNLDCDLEHHSPLQSSIEHPRLCSQSALDKFPEHHERVSRINTQSECIEAMDVDTTYQPPPQDRLSSPVACFYIRFRANIYHRAVYLTERTAHNLTQKIAQKQCINPDRIIRIIHISQAGLQIIADDDFVRELPEGQDMTAELVEVPMADTDTDFCITGFEVTLSF